MQKVLVNSLNLLVIVYVGRVQELIPFLAALSIGKVVIGIVFVLFLLGNKDGQVVLPFWRYPQGKYLIGIAILALFSIPGSVWPGRSFEFLFYFYLKLLLFVYLIVGIVRSEEHLRKLCWGMAFSSFALCLAAIISPHVVLDRVYVGGTYDPNDLALVLVMALPLTYFLWEVENGIRRHLLLLIILLSLLVIPQTGSRGGIIALVIVILGILVKKGKRVFLKSIPILAVLAIIFTVAGKENMGRYKTIGNLEEDYSVTESIGRVEVWKRSMKLFVEHPFLGVGAGAFVTAEGRTHEGGKWSTAHNSFVQIAVELGVVGLFLHAWILWKMARQARQSPGWLSHGLEVGFYAYIVGGMFLSWAYAYAFYFFIALSMSQARIGQLQQTELQGA